MRARVKAGVLISGGGTNLQAILDAAADAAYPVEVALVFSNRADAGGLERARRAGVPTEALSHRGFPDRASYDAAVVELLRRHEVEWVCLAGYMRIVTPTLLTAFPGRVLNIHPALLPAFPGLHVQQKAIDWGVRFSGCTVHFVAAEVDMGPIILQAAVPVLQDDTEDALAARILVEEHRIYPEAVKLYFEGRLEVRGRRVFVLDPGA